MNPALTYALTRRQLDQLARDVAAVAKRLDAIERRLQSPPPHPSLQSHEDR